jgi:SagB-type dehydrogenase family enzyme
VSHAGGPRYRRSRHVVFYWKKRTLIAHNYAAGTRVVAQPLVCEVLHFFDDWRTRAALVAVKPQLNHADLPTLLDLLVERDLLLRSDLPETGRERRLEEWGDWNPAAAFFHGATRDVAYGDLPTIERMTRDKARTTPMPPAIKRYPDAPVRALPRADAPAEFAGVLCERRTWRRFGRRPIAFADLGTLLGLTAGVQAWVDGSAGQRVALKTSPSGGARHSIELYVLAVNVHGLTRGLYHYACDRHALELVRPGTPARAVARYLPQQPWFEGASALFFFTAVFPRVQWRYTHARAYRATLIEAGHLCQTLCLTATALGLAPFCSMALADTVIERDLAIDGVSEAVVYAAGVGTRPSGLGWEASNNADGHPRLLTPRQKRRFPGQIPQPRR